MGKTKRTQEPEKKALKANLKPTTKSKQWVKKRDEQLKDFVSLANTAGLKERQGRKVKVKDEVWRFIQM